MADTSAEEIAHLEELAGIWRRRLRLLDVQLAKVAGNPSAVAQISFEHAEAERQLDQVLANLRRLRPSPVADRSPYLGLLTFQEVHADIFFGRDTLVDDLVERARRAPFLAVLGASGSGKSSVVRAGLIPMLKAAALPGSETWRYLTLKPGARPLDTLAAQFARLQGEPAAVVRYGETLNSGPRALLLLAEALLDRAAGQRLVLVVDQFEELWTLAPAEGEARDAFLTQQQRPFIQLLLTATTALDTPLLVVLTMRADFLHRAAEDAALAHAIAEHDLIVSPMSLDELRAAIVRPAELANGSFEPGLVDELIAQVAGRPGALPLLEYTLAELWSQRQPDGTMTWEAFRALGGVEGALAARADAILAARYTPEQQEALRHILLRLVQPGEGAADTRRRVRLDDLVPAGESPDALYALLKPLIDERLLTTGRDSASGEETLEVSHEALIHAWPTLGRWVGQARADLRFQLQLEQAAQEWQDSAENPELLWSGLRLSNAEAWLDRLRPRLNARDQAFLEASHTAAERRAVAEEAARRRELEQAQALAAEQQRRLEEQSIASRRLRRRALFLAGGLAIALVAAVGAGWFWLAAQRDATLALARQLVVQAGRDAATEPDRALLFSVEANRLTDEAQARGSLLSVLIANERLLGFMPGHTDAVLSVAFSPDGKVLASASFDGRVRLWDVASRQPLGDILHSHTEAMHSVAFSPDGKVLASASGDGTVRLWDVTSRQPLGDPLQGHSGAVSNVVFSPDGKLLASAGFDGRVRLWDVASRQPLGDPLQGHSGAVSNVVFSPDGRLLASASDDQTIRLWDVVSRQPLGDPLRSHTDAVHNVVFSPDGRLLASASDDQTIQLWDVASRQTLGAPLRGHTGAVESVAFSPDGKLLASASGDRTVRLWDVASRQTLGDPLHGHTDAVLSVAFSPDGNMLASASRDQAIRLWDVASRQTLGDPLHGHTDAVLSVAFSPDGKLLASAGDDKSIRLWDVASRQTLGDPLQGHTGRVLSVAFSPDGKLLASAGDDTSIRLWDMASRQPLGDPLQGHAGGVRSVVFSPDGKLLASAGDDTSIRLWDMASRQPLGDPLRGHTSVVWNVAFSPDDKLLASASLDSTVRLWDVASRQPLGDPLRGHTDSVQSVAFSPDGSLLASAGFDGTVRLWDVVSRQPLGDPLRGHAADVYSVAFSPDGNLMASAGSDGTVRLWDVASRQPLGDPLQDHTSSVKSVVFSPDGKLLASASRDGTVRLWEVSVEAWIARACRIAGRNLTQDEWNQFVSPDRPYRRICPAFPPGAGAPENAP